MVFASGLRLQHNAKRLAVSSRMPNGLEMSRPAGEGRAAWAETSCTGAVPSAQDQTQE